MLLLDVVNYYKSKGFPDEDELAAALLATPHYHSDIDTLKKLMKDGLETLDLSDAEKRAFDLNYQDINLPHGALILTVIDLTKNTIMESVYLLTEKPTHINARCYFAFPGLPKGRFLSVSGKMSAPSSEDRTGCDFTILSDNFKEFGIEEDGKEEKQVSQYAYNMISSFNVAINKAKTTREGTETRSWKVHKNRKGKKAYADHTIIHLNSINYINKSIGAKGSNSNILWNHSWVVRGHWRYFTETAKIGRDRTGNRTETGRTWIKPYQKQKDLELKNKIREIR